MVVAISVIMAVYNDGQFIRGAIDSVLAQRFTDFEFIIINDGSSDNTSEVLAGFTDGRIKILENKKNIGLTPSLNMGIEAASGDFIARIDVDDRWSDNHLENLYGFIIKNSQTVLVGASTLEVIDFSEILSAQLVDDNGEIEKIEYDDLAGKNQFCHSAVMFRKNVGGKTVKYRNEFVRSQDYDLWLRLVMSGEVYRLPNKTCFYLRRTNAISLANTFDQLIFAERAKMLAVQRRRCEDGRDCLDRDKIFPKIPSEKMKELKRRSCDVAIHFSWKMIKGGKYLSGLKIFWQAVTSSPLASFRQICENILDALKGNP